MPVFQTIVYFLDKYFQGEDSRHTEYFVVRNRLILDGGDEEFVRLAIETMRRVIYRIETGTVTHWNGTPEQMRLF